MKKLSEREQWAFGMLKHCDYETFLEYANEYELDELKKITLACDNPDGQCHLECPAYRDRKACKYDCIGESVS